MNNKIYSDNKYRDNNLKYYNNFITLEQLKFEQNFIQSLRQYVYYNQLKHCTYESILLKVNQEMINYNQSLLELFTVLENKIQYLPFSNIDLEFQNHLITIINQKISIQRELRKLYLTQQQINDRIFKLNFNLHQILHMMTYQS